jgi:hypothetical protein
MIAEGRVVSQDYFATMQIPLMGGERCAHQPLGGTRDAVVNPHVRQPLSRWMAVGRRAPR